MTCKLNYLQLIRFGCFACTLMLLASCLKDETPIARHESGNVNVSTLSISPDYRYQVYYNLEQDSVISRNLKTDWDLGFECSADGFHVILNEAKAMFAVNKKTSDMAAVTDTLGFTEQCQWDAPSGDLNETAIGNWLNKNEVYIIDRGVNPAGQHQGFFKIQFQSVSPASYSIHFSDLAGLAAQTMVIPKDSAYNFTFFSYSDGGKLVNVEPPKAAWDLCFTQYMHIFYNPLTTYLVAGCLLNRYQTSALTDSVGQFSNISFESIKNVKLHTRINEIGYYWKIFADGNYTARPEVNYVIKDQKGIYYKLHFIDFYNQAGQKGWPKWEYQRL
ncbi:MAG: HmuY family protein [Bacteroidia bacterium]|nr:HmuY family protein [Bacteroidia bacterium]